MPDVPVLCARCAARFIPTVAQIGQRKRGRRLYCSPECCTLAAREKSRAFWRSPEGLKYAKRRRRAAKKLAATGGTA